MCYGCYTAQRQYVCHGVRQDCDNQCSSACPVDQLQVVLLYRGVAPIEPDFLSENFLGYISWVRVQAHLCMVVYGFICVRTYTSKLKLKISGEEKSEQQATSQATPVWLEEDVQSHLAAA